MFSADVSREYVCLPQVLNKKDSELWGNLSTVFGNLSGRSQREEKAELSVEVIKGLTFFCHCQFSSIQLSPLQMLMVWTLRAACQEGYKAAVEKRRSDLIQK